jgi:hypothetical protein
MSSCSDNKSYSQHTPPISNTTTRTTSPHISQPSSIPSPLVPTVVPTLSPTESVHTQKQQQHAEVLVDETAATTEEGWMNAMSPQAVLPPYMLDVDDESIYTLDQEHSVAYHQHDLYWSFCSDFLFLCGGISYVVLCLWDWIWPPPEFIYNFNDATGTYDPFVIRNYYGMDVIAPGVYLVNAVVDMLWANQAKERFRYKWDMFQNWNCYRQHSSIDDDTHRAAKCSSPLHHSVALSPASISSPISPMKPLPKPLEGGLTWTQWCRKYAAHRSTLLSAATFGLAAFFGVAASLVFYVGIYSTHKQQVDLCLFYSDLLDRLSDHTYIVSALICLTGKRTRPWLTCSDEDPNCWSSTDFLEDAGDLLFLMGSLMDSILGDLDLEEPIWQLISSLLWLLDACLYLRSDFIMRDRMRDVSCSGSGSMDDKSTLV